MKKSKLLVVLLLVAIACLSLVACEQHFHKYNWAISTEPTETAKGEATGTCSCGSVVTRELAALTDKSVWTVNSVESSKATCQTEGKVVYDSVFGSVTVEQAKLEHNFGAWRIEMTPSAQVEGRAVRYCSVGGEKETLTLPVLTDTTFWTVTTVPAIHGQKGSNTYENKENGITIVQETSAVIHEYKEVIDERFLAAEADCTHAKSYFKSCQCGEMSEEVFYVGEAKGHSFGAWEIVSAVTETTPGAARHTCGACSEQERIDLPVLADSSFWTVNVVEATHNSVGNKTFTNTEMNLVVEVEIAKIPHVFQNVADEAFLKTPADCAHAAIYNKSCSCGAVSEQQTFTVGLAKGHSYNAWSIATQPTATVKGQATRVCSTCNHVDEVELPVLTDTTFWTATVVDATHTTNGKASYTNAQYKLAVESILPAEGHTFGGYTVTLAATCTTEGSAVHACEVCGQTETIVIDALGHKWSADSKMVYAITYDEETMEPTGSEPTDYHAHYCTVCGASDTENKEKHVMGNAEYVFVTYQEYHSVSILTKCASCEHTETDSDTLAGFIEGDLWTKTGEQAPTYAQAGWIEYRYTRDTSVVVRYPVAKLVAPYENKSFSVLEVYRRGEDEMRNVSTYAWTSAGFTVDAVGHAVGHSSPFDGEITIEVVNAASGQIKLTVTKDGSSEVFNGFVCELGIMVVTNDAFKSAYVLSPFEISIHNVAGSYWNGAMALNYNVDCNTGMGHDYGIAIIGQRVYFDVTYKTFAGVAVAAENIVNGTVAIDNVAIHGNAGQLVGAFVNNGTALVEADGLQGQYQVDLGEGQQTITLSGCGTFTVGTKAGTYQIVDGQSYTADMYVVEGGKNVAYYQITVADGTMTAVKPMVTITYNVGTGGQPLAAEQVNIKVPFTPATPVSTVSGNVLYAWFLDEELTQQIGATFIPTQNTTLYASWVQGVRLSVKDEIGGDTAIVVPNGLTIADYLPAYEKDKTISASGTKYFAGWTLDGDVVDVEVAVEAEHNGIELVALWKDLPAYAGTYYGSEVWNGGYGNSGGKKLTIGIDGKISGQITGQVVSYDGQKITWRNSSGSVYNFYFDAATKVILGIYSNYDIGNDYYVFGQHIGTNGKVAANYGVYSYKYGSTSLASWYHQFIQMDTALGKDTIIYTYNNVIYSNVTITDAFGNALAVNKNASNSIEKATTLIVRDSNGSIILKIASAKGVTFKDSTNTSTAMTRLMDEYFGTYTNGADTLVLNGVGAAIYTVGGVAKNATYTKTASGFDMYVVDGDGNQVEFHTFTLSGNSFNITTPVAAITFVTEYSSVSAKNVIANKNVALTLPVLTDATHVFRGWYVNGDATQALVGETYVPTADVTLVAKWDDKVTFTATYNDGATAELVVDYGKGDTVNVTEPEWAEHAFLGWFTDATFAEGTEWTNGSVITENIHVYAKWGPAPIYNKLYKALGAKGTTPNGGVTSADNRDSTKLDVNTKGLATCTSWPFSNKQVAISNYNETTGAVSFVVDGKDSYRAFISADGNIIVISDTKGDVDMAQLWIWTTGTVSTSSLSSSYWNAGKTRCLAYTNEGTTTNIFVHENKVYFGVTFTTASGTPVEGKDCYQAATLIVKDASGNVIVKCGYDGTTMQAMDGYEGTYTCVEGITGSVALDGIKTVTIGEHTGTYTKAAEGAGYDFDVYMTEGAQTVYYQLSVSKADSTCRINKPMATLSFTSAFGTFEPTLQANLNVAFTLPADLTDTANVFLGWYVTGDASQTIVTEVTPTANASYTAKWAAKIVLTIVRGNGYDQASLDLYAGEEFDLSTQVAVYKDGKLFKGWFTDEAFTTAFTATSIETATTIYAKWEESAPLVIENGVSPITVGGGAYAWSYDAESNTYTSTNQGKGSSVSIIKLTVYEDGTLSFGYTADSEANWDMLMVLINKTNVSDKNAGDINVSGAGQSGTYTKAVKAGDVIYISYRKDGSGNSNTDTATVSNITLTVA